MPLTLDKLKWMRDGIAALVVDEPVYMPIFERLESMIAEAKARTDIASRARRLVQRRRDMDALI